MLVPAKFQLHSSDKYSYTANVNFVLTITFRIIIVFSFWMPRELLSIFTKEKNDLKGKIYPASNSKILTYL